MGGLLFSELGRRGAELREEGLLVKAAHEADVGDVEEIVKGEVLAVAGIAQIGSKVEHLKYIF